MGSVELELSILPSSFILWGPPLPPQFFFFHSLPVCQIVQFKVLAFSLSCRHLKDPEHIDDQSQQAFSQAVPVTDYRVG